jgi:hypothetical protein
VTSKPKENLKSEKAGILRELYHEVLNTIRALWDWIGRLGGCGEQGQDFR